MSTSKLVFGQRRDYTWYGPVSLNGRTPAAAARGIAGGRRAIVERQKSGAVVYRAPDSDDAETVAIVIPASLRPYAHHCDVGAWLDQAAEE